MAFDLTKWGKLDNNPHTSINNIWGYSNTSDSLSTIKGSDYFATVSNQLSVDDVIRVTASDGVQWLTVNQVSSTVETDIETKTSLTQGSILVGDANGEESELDASTNANILQGDGTTVVSNAMSGDVTIDNTGSTTIGTVIDASKANTYAQDNATAGMPVLLDFGVPGGATNTQSITINQKLTVIDFWFVLESAGTSGDTLQLTDADDNNISDALDVSGTDKAIVRAGEIDDANRVQASGGALKVVETDNSGSDSPAGSAYVLAYVTA